jgi:hypothetical protein
MAASSPRRHPSVRSLLCERLRRAAAFPKSGKGSALQACRTPVSGPSALPGLRGPARSRGGPHGHRARRSGRDGVRRACRRFAGQRSVRTSLSDARLRLPGLIASDGRRARERDQHAGGGRDPAARGCRQRECCGAGRDARVDGRGRLLYRAATASWLDRGLLLQTRADRVHARGSHRLGHQPAGEAARPLSQGSRPSPQAQ